MQDMIAMIMQKAQSGQPLSPQEQAIMQQVMSQQPGPQMTMGAPEIQPQQIQLDPMVIQQQSLADLAGPAMADAGGGGRRGGSAGQHIPFEQAQQMAAQKKQGPRAAQAKRLQQMVSAGKLSPRQAKKLMRLFKGGEA